MLKCYFHEIVGWNGGITLLRRHREHAVKSIASELWRCLKKGRVKRVEFKSLLFRLVFPLCHQKSLLIDHRMTFIPSIEKCLQWQTRCEIKEIVKWWWPQQIGTWAAHKPVEWITHCEFCFIFFSLHISAKCQYLRDLRMLQFIHPQINDRHQMPLFAVVAGRERKSIVIRCYCNSQTFNEIVCAARLKNATAKHMWFSNGNFVTIQEKNNTINYQINEIRMRFFRCRALPLLPFPKQTTITVVDLPPRRSIVANYACNNEEKKQQQQHR